jgi:hypothetical protein
VIEKSGEISKKIYFILRGQIHIMDKNGMYEYGIIHDDGYFGDISILLNQPSEFAYYNNHYSDIAMLTLDSKNFLDICSQHPFSRDILVDRAKQRL